MMDPILQYLLDLNKTFDIEYTERLVIPLGGLQAMLDNFDKFKLNRVEVTKDELVTQAVQTQESTLDELYDLID